MSCGAPLWRAYLLSWRPVRLHAHTGLGKGKKPFWLHSSIIHPPFGAAHVSGDGRQPTQTAGCRSRPWFQSAGGSDGCGRQPIHTGGGASGRGKRTLLRFSLWRLQIRRVAVYNLGVRTFSARHHSEVEMAPWKNVSWYLIVIIKGYFSILMRACIFQKPTNTGANHFISFHLFI